MPPAQVFAAGGIIFFVFKKVLFYFSSIIEIIK